MYAKSVAAREQRPSHTELAALPPGQQQAAAAAADQLAMTITIPLISLIQDGII